MSAADGVRRLAVVKIGGSVLNGLGAFRSAASYLEREGRCRACKLLVVVSAEYGHTDALAREANALTDAPDAESLDLLWSTGELRSVALLTLALKRIGMTAVGLNAHETGLDATDGTSAFALNGITLRVAVARHDVVVVPGFLATRRRRVVTLGRGGSDLSAVVLAAALGADECVLIKDVDGYFTADPATHPDAQPVRALTYASALQMADAGCPLVQRQAIATAQRTAVPIVIRSFSGTGTILTNDSGRAAVPAIA